MPGTDERRLMFVPYEIKIAVKDLTDFMLECNPGNKVAIRREAVRLLQEIWTVREQIPVPESSVSDYFTLEQRDHGLNDQRAAQEALYGERLIGHALDKDLIRINVWERRSNQEAVDVSWIDLVVDRVIRRLELTKSDLETDPPESGHRYLVKLNLDPMRGWEVFKDEVKDLTPEQKAALANAVRYQGLPGDTAEGIFYSLYLEVENHPPEDYINLGAIVGLFYRVFLKLREDRDNR